MSESAVVVKNERKRVHGAHGSSKDKVEPKVPWNELVYGIPWGRMECGENAMSYRKNVHGGVVDRHQKSGHSVSHELSVNITVRPTVADSLKSPCTRQSLIMSRNIPMSAVVRPGLSVAATCSEVCIQEQRRHHALCQWVQRTMSRESRDGRERGKRRARKLERIYHAPEQHKNGSSSGP